MGGCGILFRRRTKRAAVVKITRESEDITVAPKVCLVSCHAAHAHQGLGDALAFVNRGVVELAHCKDESNYARLLDERPQA